MRVKTPKYNDYFKENLRIFDAHQFIALATVHIPPKYKQLIRIYGRLCNTPYSNYNWKQRSCKAKENASRYRGKWEGQEHLVRLTPVGWQEKKQQEVILAKSKVEDKEKL